MKEQISEALLNRYLDQTCSPEEAHMVESWYRSMGGNWSAEEWEALRSNEDLRLRMLHNIKAKAGIFQRERVPQRRLSVWLGAAAAFLLLFMATFLFKGELRSFFGIRNASIEFVNKSKTILKRTLPDGSIVWLNPDASLSYSGNFGQASRVLEMDGEVFFEVAKDEKRPFIIRSGELITKVLGTSFRIKVDAIEGEEVSVVSGMVAVSRQKQQTLWEKALHHEQHKPKHAVLLTADQKVSLDKGERNLVKAKEEENSSVKMWQRKSTSFEDAPLKSIVDTLNRTYRVTIGFKDQELSNYTLTADFSRLNLISVMEIMSQSLNIRYEISGNQIWLMKN